MIPQLISKIATFRLLNLSTDEIVAAIRASLAYPRNMILDILTLQNNLTDSEIIAVVGLRETKGLYAEQPPIRNEAKQVLADAKLASQLDAKLNGVQAWHRLKLVTGIASGGSSPSSSSAPAKPTSSMSSSSSVVSLPSSKVIAKTATVIPSPAATAKAASSSSSASAFSPAKSSGALSSASVPIVTAATTKAKPVQKKKSGVEYDWIEIEDEQFMIDKKGNVYDPEDENQIGTYDKTQKKWLSGGTPSVDDKAAEVEECTIDGETYLKDDEGIIYDFKTEDPVGKYNFKTKKWIIKFLISAPTVHNPQTAASASSASASSSSSAAKYDEEDRALMAVRAEKNRKLSQRRASRIACHIASETALTKQVSVYGNSYTYNFHSIFDQNGTCVHTFLSPDCNLSDELLVDKVRKAIYTKTHSEKKKIQLQSLRQKSVQLAEVKEIVNQ